MVEKQQVIKSEIIKDLKQIVRRETEDIIKREIDLYDADKTNKADYALESTGAIIIANKCSKTYLTDTMKYSLDGVFPVYWTSFTPQIVIQSKKVNPGECWAFKGAEGKLIIRLSRRIVPTSFTYEHVRKELSPDSNIDSAPRLFQVRSLRNEHDEEGLLLGEYEYDEYRGPLQQFDVLNPHPVPTEFIVLHIFSNHGEMEFTCLYRFRVHGNKIDS